MNAPRWLAILASVSMLFLPATITAQDATPITPSIERQVLFEMTLMPADLPDQFVKLDFDRSTVAPGADITFGALDEGIRGRGLYLESGELLVKSLVPSPVWRGNEEIGAPPEVVQPGGEIHLAAGDSMLIPVMATSEIAENTGIRLANPATVAAVFVGFHLHEQGGTFSYPQGLAFTSGSDFVDLDSLARIKAGATLFRVTRMTAEPGAILPLSDDAVVTFFLVEEGRVAYTATGAGGSFTKRVPAGQSIAVQSRPDLTSEVKVTGNKPAVVFEMAVIPSAPAAEESEVPASATPDA